VAVVSISVYQLNEERNESGDPARKRMWHVGENRGGNQCGENMKYHEIVEMPAKNISNSMAWRRNRNNERKAWRGESSAVERRRRRNRLAKRNENRRKISAKMEEMKSL
jgi:hypothetical protein